MRPALKIGFYALTDDLETVWRQNNHAVTEFVDELRTMPIALFTPDANEQHYEVETKFFDIALGLRKKYSSGLWPDGSQIANAGSQELEAAEDRMLSLYAERAQIADGQTILDLGCGWGSVTLFLAERFPNAKITGVSNSRTQREYILGKARERGFSNVAIETLNVAGPDFVEFLKARRGKLDRVISIEMFEHMKNYPALLRLLSEAMAPSGKLFLHFFCHKYLPYHFKEDDLNGWMTSNFFKGGTMPSQFLLHHFQDDLSLQRQWVVNGFNYTLTLEGWLQRMDSEPMKLLEAFRPAYDEKAALLQIRRWRIFMIACAEFFGFRQGSEFFVTHLLFGKNSSK